MKCKYCGLEGADNTQYWNDYVVPAHTACLDEYERRDAEGLCIGCGKHEAAGYCYECVRAGMKHVGYGGGAA